MSSTTSTEREESLKSFWVVLEFRISGELYNPGKPDLKGFSCDGIFLSSSDPQLEHEYIYEHRKITTIAWLGKGGQDKYDATIHFGTKAQHLSAENLPLEDSIPAYENGESWFDIDVQKKTIDIHLE